MADPVPRWMRWARSLQGRIQAWYAAILILSLLAFGAMLYWESSRAIWREIDADLTSGVRILESAMRLPPPPPPFRNAPPFPMDGHPDLGDGPPRRPEFRDRDGERREGTDRPTPPQGPFAPPNSDDPRFPPRDRPPPRPIDGMVFERMAPLRLVRRDSVVYYALWDMDATVIQQYGAVDAMPIWDDIRGSLRSLREGNVVLRQRGSIREAIARGPRSSVICVGVDVQPERDRLTRFCSLLAGSGLMVCVLGLAGGAWCLRRTLRPMRAMQATASTIRPDNLSQRLNVESMDTELAEFAGTINSMLDRVETGFEQQRQFAADASHELRTPLAILVSSTELALSRERSAEAYRTELEKCQRAAQRMKTLIEALLTLSRMDAENQSLAMEPVSVDAVCREQVELHQHLAAEHDVTITTHLEECIVVGHAGILERMVANLLLNSILYNRPQGSVTLTLTQGPETVMLEISDTGIGVPAAEIPHLFKRFYRVDKARSRLTGGSGLGLAICDLVVQLHHGKIDVESQVGAGSTFRILLPKRPA